MRERIADRRPRTPTRPEHSDAYWQTMKYAIIGLAILMVVALVLAVIVLLGMIPWT